MNQTPMKITPHKLITGWNALAELVKVNKDDDLFVTEVLLVEVQLQNEVSFWNGLSQAQRTAIQGKQMTVQFDKIEKVPRYYANDQIDVIQPFFKTELEKKTPAMAKLLESQTELNQEEVE